MDIKDLANVSTVVINSLLMLLKDNHVVLESVVMQLSNNNDEALSPDVNLMELTQQTLGELKKAKASVVPAVIGDIQSWIAVNSFSALDAVHDNVPIVDANELAKYIDSLDLSVAVPEGFKVVSFKQICELAVAVNKVDLMTHTEQKTNEVRLAWQDIASKLQAMIEAQELSND